MGKLRKAVRKEPGAMTASRARRDQAIIDVYKGRPSPKALAENGQIDARGRAHAERVRASGPPLRPFRELVAALRAERERQGLSLSDLAERTGMDRAAVHKLEIGLNTNPTHSTLERYASALGARIEWQLKTNSKKSLHA